MGSRVYLWGFQGRFFAIGRCSLSSSSASETLDKHTFDSEKLAVGAHAHLLGDDLALAAVGERADGFSVTFDLFISTRETRSSGNGAFVGDDGQLHLGRGQHG